MISLGGLSTLPVDANGRLSLPATSSFVRQTPVAIEGRMCRASTRLNPLLNLSNPRLKSACKAWILAPLIPQVIIRVGKSIV